MSECIHTHCNKKTREKIYHCGKKIKKDKLCCKKCQTRKDLVVCLACMNVYCKREDHLKRLKHVLFYDLENQILICSYCDKQTPVIFPKGHSSTIQNDGSLVVNYTKLPNAPFRVLQSKVLRGFQNLGNTCYVNALFHILLNLERFRRSIIKERHPIKECGSCIICNIKLVIKRLDVQQELTLKELINCIMNVNSEYKNDDQHDIHTFYLNVIEMIQRHSQRSTENSFAQDLFSGSMRSTLKCLQCGFNRHTIENFCSISLNHTKTLSDSFNEYFLDENIQDKLFCQNCKADTIFSKSLEIVQSSEILVVHIKRFKFINTVTKINDKIEIQREIRVGDSDYKLEGFVQHRGDIEHGHYVCYVLLDDFWYEFDDNIVRKMILKNVPFHDSYLLFYSRENVSHPGE